MAWGAPRAPPPFRLLYGLNVSEVKITELQM